MTSATIESVIMGGSAWTAAKEGARHRIRHGREPPFDTM
jgi:hypothetical protein